MQSNNNLKKSLGFFLLIIFTQNTTAEEIINVFEPLLPNHSANYTENSKVSLTDGYGGKTSGTLTNKYQMSTSTIKKNGNINITIKSSNVQMTIDGKDETPSEGDNKSITFTQLADGSFSNLPPEEQKLLLMEQAMLPRKMIAQEKYTIKVDDDLTSLLQDTAIFKDYDLKSQSTGWARLNKVDENYAWGELHLTIKIIDMLDYEMYEIYGDPIPEDENTIKIDSQLDATFIYNRKTHFIEERETQYKSKIMYEGSKSETLFKNNMKLTK